MVRSMTLRITSKAKPHGESDLFPWAETCAVHFIQPRRDEVSSHVFRRDDLEEVRFRLRLVVERATEPEPALNPEHDTCRFCHNRLSCPALRDRLLPIARKHVANDFAVDLLQKYSPSQVKDPEVLSKMMVVAPVMEKWAAEAKKHAAKVAQETGEDIPGYNLAYRSAPQRVKDAQLAYDVLKDNIDPEVFAEGCSVSLPALAKAYATANQIPVTKARGFIEGAFIQEGLLESDDDLEKIPYLRKK